MGFLPFLVLMNFHNHADNYIQLNTCIYGAQTFRTSALTAGQLHCCCSCSCCSCYTMPFSSWCKFLNLNLFKFRHTITLRDICLCWPLPSFFNLVWRAFSFNNGSYKQWWRFSLSVTLHLWMSVWPHWNHQSKSAPAKEEPCCSRNRNMLISRAVMVALSTSW